MRSAPGAGPSATGAGPARRRHTMPFGAETGGDGVRFALWAPSARAVDLCLEVPGLEVPGLEAPGLEAPGSRRFLPMEPAAGGWFRLRTDLAAHGSRYRYRIDGGECVPDPASRSQPGDVHGPSEVLDPLAWTWGDAAWTGRPWEEAVVYEIHVGAFTPAGSFDGVRERLDHLVDLGVSAIELMPVADFPGRRNWGFDGVYPFAPEARYGGPAALKALVEAAHARGLMVFLDVVYNHFGPEGNYLHRYAPQFFSTRHETPWGAGINFDGEHSRTVRDFFIHNACYWIEEYAMDGLRLDAAHAIRDDSRPDILEELARAVREGPGRHRHVHLVLENDDNRARYLRRDRAGRPRWYDAQWNEDLHHALHVLVSGERDGYYADYAARPVHLLGRALAEGFAYQGEASAFRHGAPRGESTRGLPPAAFVAFLQNHDQIGNRALGERVTALAPPAALRAALAIVLLAPSPPLLFMGQEWGAPEPFPFFCDFPPELARAVREGRRREFAQQPGFAGTQALERLPDPGAEATFAGAVLDWRAREGPDGREWLALHRRLLALRAREITPRLGGVRQSAARYTVLDDRGLRVEWQLAGGARLVLLANPGDRVLAKVPALRGTPLYTSHEKLAASPPGGRLPPWGVAWFLELP